MKVGNPSSFKSFGLPQQMKEEVERVQMAKEERPKVDEPAPSMQKATDDGFNTDDLSETPSETLKKEESVIEPKDPIQVLKDELGIELEEDDFHKLIFKGYTDKDVIVIPSVKGSRPLIATFKTLTAREQEEVDEYVAEDMNRTRMTVDGHHDRRWLWLLAFGVTKLQGRTYADPVYKDEGKKVLDRKATYSARREKLSSLSPVIVSKMSRIHAQLTLALNTAIDHPEADYLKKL